MSEYRETTWHVEFTSTLDFFVRGERTTEEDWRPLLGYSTGVFLREESAHRYVNEYLIPENNLRHLYRIRKVTTIKDTVWSMDPSDLDGEGIK